MKKYYYCRHCGKRYLSQFDADLCFEIDMKNLIKSQNNSVKLATIKK